MNDEKVWTRDDGGTVCFNTFAPIYDYGWIVLFCPSLHT